MNHLNKILLAVAITGVMGCAQEQTKPVTEEEAVRIDRTLVKGTVVYEAGAKDGAVVPDIFASRMVRKLNKMVSI